MTVPLAALHRRRRPTWPQRRPAIGAVIKPRQDLNLVFGLIRTTVRDGTSDGPAIVYTASGNTYTKREGVTLTVSPNCDAPAQGSGPSAALCGRGDLTLVLAEASASGRGQ